MLLIGRRSKTVSVIPAPAPPELSGRLDHFLVRPRLFPTTSNRPGSLFETTRLSVSHTLSRSIIRLRLRPRFISCAPGLHGLRTSAECGPKPQSDSLSVQTRDFSKRLVS